MLSASYKSVDGLLIPNSEIPARLQGIVLALVLLDLIVLLAYTFIFPEDDGDAEIGTSQAIQAAEATVKPVPLQSQPFSQSVAETEPVDECRSPSPARSEAL